MNFLKVTRRLLLCISQFPVDLFNAPDSLFIITVSLINCRSPQTVKTAVFYMNRKEDSHESFFTDENYGLHGASCSTIKVSNSEIVLVSVASTFNKDADYLCHQVVDFIRSM